MEVAPGVVDASAVALPDHVISDEESVYDEEDELDALDDEPMVSVGRVDHVTGAQPTVNCEASQALASRVGRRLVIVSQDLPVHGQPSKATPDVFHHVNDTLVDNDSDTASVSRASERDNQDVSFTAAGPAQIAGILFNLI